MQVAKSTSFGMHSWDWKYKRSPYDGSFYFLQLGWFWIKRYYK